jgi:recombination associated protein RdgC
MFFKTLQIFSLKEPENIDLTALAEKIPEFALKECGTQDAFSFGWMPLIRNSEQWSLGGNQCLLIRAGKEEKHLPSDVVRDELENKVSEIELVEGRKVGRKEKADMKDEVVFTLRPKAFPRRTDVWAYIDLRARILVINSTNASMTELLFKQLQTTLGSFPMTPMQAQVSPSSMMTEWLLKNQLPGSLETNDECEIQDSSEDKAAIRFKSLEPLSEDITRHLQQGMHVRSLALRWTDKLSFTLHDNLTLRKVKFDDALKEAAFNDSQGGHLSDMDANFAIVSGTIRELFASLCIWFEVDQIVAGKE